MSRLDKYNRKPGSARSAKAAPEPKHAPKTSRDWTSTKPAREVRSVPLSTAISVLIGGGWVQVGAILFTVAMIAWWFFGMRTDFTSWYRFSGTLDQTTGVMLGAEDTGITVNDGPRIHKVYYSFTAPDGTKIESHSYADGQPFEYQQAVDVEFRPDDPAISRIVGTRKQPISLWGIFVVLFPLAGLLIMLRGLRMGARGVRLLWTGEITRGRLKDKAPTSTVINGQPVQKFTFEFSDAGGRTHEMSFSTHDSKRIEDEETEMILYNRDRPADAVLVDALPGSLSIVSGRAAPVAIGLILRRMVFPVGGVGAHVLIGVLWYLYG